MTKYNLNYRFTRTKRGTLVEMESGTRKWGKAVYSTKSINLSPRGGLPAMVTMFGFDPVAAAAFEAHMKENFKRFILNGHAWTEYNVEIDLKSSSFGKVR